MRDKPNLGDLFYNHPLGTVTASSHISTDHSQRRLPTDAGGKEQPHQRNSVRRCRGEHTEKLGQTEEQREGLEANTQVQDQEHKEQLWQSGELFEFPVMAHHVRRTCLHGSMWPIIPQRKLSNSFIFAHIPTKALGSAAIYLLAAVVTNRATYIH